MSIAHILEQIIKDINPIPPKKIYKLQTVYGHPKLILNDTSVTYNKSLDNTDVITKILLTEISYSYNSDLKEYKINTHDATIGTTRRIISYMIETIGNCQDIDREVYRWYNHHLSCYNIANCHRTFGLPIYHIFKFAFLYSKETDLISFDDTKIKQFNLLITTLKDKLTIKQGWKTPEPKKRKKKNG